MKFGSGNLAEVKPQQLKINRAVNLLIEEGNVVEFEEMKVKCERKWKLLRRKSGGRRVKKEEKRMNEYYSR